MTIGEIMLRNFFSKFFSFVCTFVIFFVALFLGMILFGRMHNLQYNEAVRKVAFSVVTLFAILVTSVYVIFQRQRDDSECIRYLEYIKERGRSFASELRYILRPKKITVELLYNTLFLFVLCAVNTGDWEITSKYILDIAAEAVCMALLVQVLFVLLWLLVHARWRREMNRQERERRLRDDERHQEEERRKARYRQGYEESL